MGHESIFLQAPVSKGLTLSIVSPRGEMYEWVWDRVNIHTHKHSLESMQSETMTCDMYKLNTTSTSAPEYIKTINPFNTDCTSYNHYRRLSTLATERYDVTWRHETVSHSQVKVVFRLYIISIICIIDQKTKNQ